MSVTPSAASVVGLLLCLLCARVWIGRGIELIVLSIARVGLDLIPRSELTILRVRGLLSEVFPRAWQTQFNHAPWGAQAIGLHAERSDHCLAACAWRWHTGSKT